MKYDEKNEYPAVKVAMEGESVTSWNEKCHKMDKRVECKAEKKLNYVIKNYECDGYYVNAFSFRILTEKNYWTPLGIEPRSRRDRVIISFQCYQLQFDINAVKLS